MNADDRAAVTGQGTRVAARLARHSAATSAEPGCRFVALRGAGHPGSFVLCERHESREAPEPHLASPHCKGIAAGRIRPPLRGRTGEPYEIIQPGGDR